MQFFKKMIAKSNKRYYNTKQIVRKSLRKQSAI